MKRLILLLFFITMNVYADKVPDFNLPIYNNDSSFHLSEKINGKKIVINFWASWCTSCIHEIPILESLKEKYGNEALFVAVNAGEKSSLIDKFLKKYKFSYLVLKDEDRLFSKSVGVDSLPITIVLDENMNILYRGNVPPQKI